MNTTIYYIIEFPAKKVHFFDWHDDAKAKEQELTEKYGYLEISKEYPGRKISEEIDRLCDQIPRYHVEYKTLKAYYGAVWYAIKWNDNDTVNLKIAGRFKELTAYKNDKAYRIKKKVFVPYEIYSKEGIQTSHQLKRLDAIRAERAKEKQLEKERIEKLKERLDRSDLSLLED